MQILASFNQLGVRVEISDEHWKNCAHKSVECPFKLECIIFVLKCLFYSLATWM